MINHGKKEQGTKIDKQLLDFLLLFFHYVTLQPLFPFIAPDCPIGADAENLFAMSKSSQNWVEFMQSDPGITYIYQMSANIYNIN